MKKRKLKKGFKIMMILVLLLALVAVSGTAYVFLYPAVKLKINLPKEPSQVEFGSELDPVEAKLDNESLGLGPEYQLSYKYDTKKVGEGLCEITVKKGKVERVFEHKIMVVDTTPPEFEVIYRYLYIKNINQNFKANIKGKITDNYDRDIKIDKMEFLGKIEDKPGIYEILYQVSDSSGNVTSKKVYYFYKLSPEMMERPFKFTWNDKEYILANKWVPLPKSYALGADKEARAQLDAMLAAMKKAGVGVGIKSGYRSYNAQQNIWNRDVARDGEVETARFLARPGYSEHQTGLTYDIGIVSANFEKTDAFKWLQQHAQEYGFSMRYPKTAESITGYGYEPWHYRYLGVELATALWEARQSGNSDLTLEEFIGFYHEN